MGRVKIIAIGGGGVTNGADPGMENAMLALCRRPAPRIGLVGTASNHDPLKEARFRARFAGLAAECRILPRDMDASLPRRWVQGLDLIYVGGGDTARLLQDWRATCLQEALLAAAEEGAVIAGVSAGAMCWFEAMLTNATGDLAPMLGLGVLPGSCTPHADQDGMRLDTFRSFIAAGQLPGGLALDDGVAVLCQADAPPKLLWARHGAAARLIRRGPKGLIETDLGSA